MSIYKNKEILNHLKDGMIVQVRTGHPKRGLYHPDWSEWFDVELYVQDNFRGEIAGIALKNYEWAEYDADCYFEPNENHPYGLFLIEDYYMELRLKEDK